MLKIRLITGLILCGVIPNQSVVAEIYEMSPIIVTASRIPSILNNDLSNSHVISRQAIEASQAVSVVDLLRNQAGLHVEQAGSMGNVGSLFLRGSDPNFVVVMIDGVKVNDPTNTRGGSFDFSTLNIDSIDRIEIVKGALSSVYGSDAISGVINIVTRSVSVQTDNNITLSNGSNEYRSASANLQGKYDAGDISLNIGYLDEGKRFTSSGFKNRTLQFTSKLKAPPNMQFKLSGHYNNTDARSLPDDSGGEQFAVIRDSEHRDIQEQVLGMTLGHEVSSYWKYSFMLNQFQHKESVDSPGVAPGVRDPFGIPPNSNVSEITRYNMVWSNTLNQSKKFTMSTGLGLLREQGDSSSVLFFGGMPISGAYQLKRDRLSAFMEGLFQLESGYAIKLGTRFDKPEHYSHEFSSSAAFMVQLPNAKLVFNWAQAYKLPSFFALGNPIVGNAELKPERSNYMELSLKQRTISSHLWRISVYAYQYKNLVDFDEGPPPQLVNRSNVTAKGLEMEWESTIATDTNLSAQLSHVQTDIQGSSAVLRNRPEWRGGITVKHKTSSSLHSHLSLIYTGKSYDSSIATGNVELGGYFRMDAATRWHIKRNWHVMVSVDNLLNENYEETVGTSSIGTVLRLAVKAQF